MKESYRNQIAELKKTQPCLTTAKIARRLGISRPAVRYHLLKLGLPTKICRQRYSCQVCGKEATYYGKYCSKECWLQDTHILVCCDVCGSLKRVERAYIIHQTKMGCKHFFCSKECLGKHNGLHYGFAIHKKFIYFRKAK